MEKYNQTEKKSSSFQNGFEREEAYLLAEKRLKSLKGFYWHLFWYLVVNVFIIISSVVINGEYYNLLHFNTYSTAVFWGIGLGVHALSVFGKNLVFSKEWEARKIQEFMNKENKRWD